MKRIVTEKIKNETKQVILGISKELTQRCFDGKQNDIPLWFDDDVINISLRKEDLYNFIYTQYLKEYMKVVK